jgi:hypothetical protein
VAAGMGDGGAGSEAAAAREAAPPAGFHPFLGFFKKEYGTSPVTPVSGAAAGTWTSPCPGTIVVGLQKGNTQCSTPPMTTAQDVYPHSRDWVNQLLSLLGIHDCRAAHYLWTITEHDPLLRNWVQ